MANRDIKKEKKKPKGGVASAVSTVLKPPVPQPEVIKKAKKDK